MNETKRTEVYRPTAGTVPAIESGLPLPAQIGRYRIEKLLGQGGFGIVYLARDADLARYVAIKVPHARLVAEAGNASLYLNEARTVASIDHPHIVPVHDVGRTEDFPCYIVSKYIDGTDLATRLKLSPLSLQEAIELVAVIAETLHFAHKQGLVHRDIKPGNILLDRGGKAFIADFGLALREQNVGKGPRHAGTPAYMSPEQARGEGHRVDGRSDIFSLGIVFYELLTGKRPFRGETEKELLEQIANIEARPPRQIVDTLPRELERICLKALAKRALERYSTAKDLAEDLRQFLRESLGPEVRLPEQVGPHQAPPAPPSTRLPSPATPSHPAKILPKGLRAFDAADADFFLGLLPGPRDREGLPDSIRFWKSRLENLDAASTFAVGLIYGPSGCGKSSLTRAGLVPRLATAVSAVAVEATPSDTETRLLHGLRRRVTALPRDLGLVESVAALRQGLFLESGCKVLLVLDQFEQWLHAFPDPEHTELARALRHCDGGRVQCLLLVRDDFWLAVSRFMQALEIRILEGANARLVDLFDARHARKVLTAFGRAFGCLPEDDTILTQEQEAFLEQSVRDLAVDGKIIPVRLSLFAEMVKDKPWLPSKLKEVGGMEGLGLQFLEDTFAASTAPPHHRMHLKSAQAVLRALLPEAGTDIKGHMRSREDLLVASGYENRTRHFDDLLLLLDGELRLITPTDPEEVDSASPPQPVPGKAPRSREQYYQLTHDYLVPSLRDWLTRKQKETRRGRAELLLADRAAIWSCRRENQQLPSIWQSVAIRWWTRKRDWTAGQLEMMNTAARVHAARGAILLLFLFLLSWAGYEAHGRLYARALRDRLLDADTNEISAVLHELAPYRRWLDPLLRQAAAQAEQDRDRRKQLHVSLALLPVDPSQVEFLTKRMLDGDPHEVRVIRDVLEPWKGTLLNDLWYVVEKPEKGKTHQRLRAASALAAYDPNNHRWTTASTKVAEDLVLVNPIHLGSWSELCRPIMRRLIEPLTVVFHDRRPERISERMTATNLLADYSSDQLAVLNNLLLDADEKQFAVLFAKLEEHEQAATAAMAAELARQLPPGTPQLERDRLAGRRANAAVALLRLGQPTGVWAVLKHAADPGARSQLIHRLGPMGVDLSELLERLAVETDLSARRALLLSLGPEEFEEDEWTPESRKQLLGQLKEIYRTADDPGLHAAAEWLLRQWKEEAWLRQIDLAWASNKPSADSANHAEDRRSAIVKTTPTWYVNRQGQRFIVIPGPVEALMGSPEDEEDHQPEESLHKTRIKRSFALAATPVTKEQYLRYQPSFVPEEPKRYPEPTCPIGGITWYEAAAYCNWLSKEENIPPDQWCYEMDSQGNVSRLRAGYLGLTGYRLPTEAEMKFATRAGATTSRFYGDSPELLVHYAWYFKNSAERTWPVGTRKPNDFGFFDLHGNLWCWCQERYKEYSRLAPNELAEDKEDSLIIAPAEFRVLHGGSFLDIASDVRAGCRLRFVPTLRQEYLGLRPARTIR